MQQELESYIKAFKSLDIDVNGSEDELGTLPELVQDAVKQLKADHNSEVATWKARVNAAADQIARLVQLRSILNVPSIAGSEGG